MSNARMADQPGDDRKINYFASEELKLWTKELDCSLMELLSAVYAVGNSESAVRKYLEK